MNKAKKWKIRGLEKALEAVPVRDRFRVGAEIRRAFAHFDPENPPGQRLRRIESGTRTCPNCGGTLVEFAILEASGRQPRQRVLDCETCGAPFVEPTDREEIVPRKKVSKKSGEHGAAAIAVRKAKRAPAPRLVRPTAREADDREEVVRLFANIQGALPQLKALLDEYSNHWGYEDLVYRLYHGSFKVYWLQKTTERIVAALHALAPDRPLSGWFLQIVREGTGKKFKPAHNKRWLAETRPIVEAFFHARYFLEMAVRYGSSLEKPPRLLPSGWAAVLCLYDLR